MGTKQDVYVKTYVEKISNLVHNDANPRLIKSKRLDDLIESLTKFPEMKLLREVVIDEDRLILAGDKRTYALEKMGYTEVTVKQVFNLTPKQKREFIIKDNDHHGEWDTDILANLWDIEEVKEFGIPPFKLPGAGNSGSGEKGDYKPHEVTCPECGHHFELSDKQE